MARDVSDSTPIGSKAELIAWIAAGEKPVSAGVSSSIGVSVMRPA